MEEGKKLSSSANHFIKLNGYVRPASSHVASTAAALLNGILLLFSLFENIGYTVPNLHTTEGLNIIG